MSAVPSALREQQARIEKLHDRLERVLRNRDRIYGERVDYPFIGEVIFPQGDNTAQDILFQVPESCDFVGQRLAAYASFRNVSTDTSANGPNDIAFRPCLWSSAMYTMNTNLQDIRALVDCFISMSETYRNAQGAQITRALQNLPTPVQALYSSPVNYRAARDVGGNLYYNASFEFPSAFVFPHDYILKAGSALTVKVAPSFACLRVDPVEPEADTTLQNEYKITVVLEGYKVMPTGKGKG